MSGESGKFSQGDGICTGSWRKRVHQPEWGEEFLSAGESSEIPQGKADSRNWELCAERRASDGVERAQAGEGLVGQNKGPAMPWGRGWSLPSRQGR